MCKFSLAVVAIFVSILPNVGYGLSFDLPKGGSNIVGEVKITQVKTNEDFTEVAKRFDIGYYEVLEANPGIDPDAPPADTVLIVPTRYVLPLELKNNTIVVNLAEMRLYYQHKYNNKVYIYPVAIGKEDWETPVGERTITHKVKNPTWVVPESIYKFRKSIGDKVERTIPPGPTNPMGSYALYLSGSGYVRIHGTNVFASVGRRNTAGCVRLYEEDITQLYSMVGVGTKVIIINKPYKAGWVNQKLYLEAHMPLFEQRVMAGDDMKPALDVVAKATKGRDTAVDWSKVKNIAKEHLVLPRAVD